MGPSKLADHMDGTLTAVPSLKYPFEPRSNSYLVPGQFWGVPFSDGSWACGRVGDQSEPDVYFQGNSRTFLAGLMNWDGDDPPTSENIAGQNLVARGWAHVATIQGMDE